jgi:hypothetical protein
MSTCHRDIRWRRTRGRRGSTGDTRNDLAGGKGINRGFEEKATGLKGIEVGVGTTIETNRRRDGKAWGGKIF